MTTTPPVATDEEPTPRLVCGYFDFTSLLATRLLDVMLDVMPDVMHIRNEDLARSLAINTLLNMTTTETGSAAPDSVAVVDKRREILFIHVSRTCLVQAQAHTPVCLQHWLMRSPATHLVRYTGYPVRRGR
jgi:hypothetical protein